MNILSLAMVASMNMDSIALKVKKKKRIPMGYQRFHKVFSISNRYHSDCQRDRIVLDTQTLEENYLLEWERKKLVQLPSETLTTVRKKKKKKMIRRERISRIAISFQSCSSCYFWIFRVADAKRIKNSKRLV
jgi:hypothetical protein